MAIPIAKEIDADIDLEGLLGAFAGSAVPVYFKSKIPGLRFRVKGLEFRVQGLGCSGFRVFRVFRVWHTAGRKDMKPKPADTKTQSPKTPNSETLNLLKWKLRC